MHAHVLGDGDVHARTCPGGRGHTCMHMSWGTGTYMHAHVLGDGDVHACTCLGGDGGRTCMHMSWWGWGTYMLSVSDVQAIVVKDKQLGVSLAWGKSQLLHHCTGSLDGPVGGKERAGGEGRRRRGQEERRRGQEEESAGRGECRRRRGQEERRRGQEEESAGGGE